MKIFLANDTSHTGHAGCVAVMKTLRSLLASYKIIGVHKVGCHELDNFDTFNQAEALVVNGEGTIHHERKWASYLMELLARAQVQRKRTLLINAVWQHSKAFWPHAVRRLDLFTVREPCSLDNALYTTKRQPLLFPDLCIDQANNGEPLPGYANRVVIGDSGVTGVMQEIFDQLGNKYITLSIFGLRFKDLVATLKTARLFVTGRHHGVYAALCAGIPFVCVPSNAHKIQGIIQWLDLDIPICMTKVQLIDQIKKVPKQRDKFQEASRRLQKLPRLTVDTIRKALYGSTKRS